MEFTIHNQVLGLTFLLAVVLGAVLLGALLWAAFHQVLRQWRRAVTV